MLETYTRLHFSIPASLNATSKDARRSLCTPAPFTKKTFLGTISFLSQTSLSRKSNTHFEKNNKKMLLKVWFRAWSSSQKGKHWKKSRGGKRALHSRCWLLLALRFRQESFSSLFGESCFFVWLCPFFYRLHCLVEVWQFCEHYAFELFFKECVLLHGFFKEFFC